MRGEARRGDGASCRMRGDAMAWDGDGSEGGMGVKAESACVRVHAAGGSPFLLFLFVPSFPRLRLSFIVCVCVLFICILFAILHSPFRRSLCSSPSHSFVLLPRARSYPSLPSVRVPPSPLFVSLCAIPSPPFYPPHPVHSSRLVLLPSLPSFRFPSFRVPLIPYDSIPFRFVSFRRLSAWLVFRGTCMRADR